MKLKNETTEQIVNEQTGEVVKVTTSKTYTIKSSTEEFYMTFISSCASLFKLKSPTDLKLTIKLCMLAEYNTGKVYLATEVRQEICKELGIVTQQLTNSLKSLKDKEIIEGGKGVFTLNPLIFWKGTSNERSKIMKDLKISISIK